MKFSLNFFQNKRTLGLGLLGVGAGMLAVFFTLQPESASPTRSEEEKRTWPIYVSTMTHLEGNWDAAITEKPFFNLQVKKLRFGMDIAEEYGGLLTIESEMPMAQAMTLHGENILQEALERGHGVGTHCDIGPSITYDASGMAKQFLQRKELVDALIGSEENIGCSGGGGRSDWYAGALGAGFKYLNGTVGYHYMALPLHERPRGWTDKAIVDKFFHAPAPQNVEQYFYPFLISELGFTEDPSGNLMLLDGSLGPLAAMAEKEPWSIEKVVECSARECPLTLEDADAVEQFIRDFAQSFDGSRPAKITVYLPTSSLSEQDEDALKAFFASMQRLVEEDVVVWETQRGTYEHVMEYYASQR